MSKRINNPERKFSGKRNANIKHVKVAPKHSAVHAAASKRAVVMKTHTRTVAVKRPTTAKKRLVNGMNKRAGTAKKIHAGKPHIAKATKAEMRKTEEAMAEKATFERTKEIIESIMQNEPIISYLNKNVSKRASEVLSLLETPKTDEQIAEILDMKINGVRRILNIMQGYGITNYNISKNVDGWLSFSWYINNNKVDQFFDYVKSVSSTESTIKDGCNDYFICDKCYKDSKMIFTFDAAYEANFKCSCNKLMVRKSKDDIEEILKAAEISKS